MAEAKKTKRDYFDELKKIAAAADREDLVDFIDAQVEALDKRAEKAKEYKAKKAAESDELKATIAATLTNQFMTADEITEIVADGDETITKAKVVSRLTALVKAEKAIKAAAKIDKKKIMVYALPGTESKAAE